MRLTAIVLLTTCLQVSASSLYGQNVNISGKNMPLRKVFNEIRAQTGYNFIYANEDLKGASAVTLHAKNATLAEVLDSCFVGQPLTYSIFKKIIIIKPKTYLNLPEASSIALIEIKGEVTDSATGKPMLGVNIQVKGSTIGTTTDAKGAFTLNAPDNAVLVISYLGYTKREIAVNGRSNINVKMKPEVSSLNQLVVVGYGTEKKVDLTGAIDQINGSQIQNRPVANVGDALQGMIANLNIYTTGSGGQPDATKSINIRGYTGYDQLSGPLILVDGVPADINSVNVNDIKTITVLKDAASSAIYGSRAPNGVVLITTKQGKKGQPLEVSYTNNLSWNNPINLPQTMNSYDFANLYNEASENAGRGAIFPQSQINGILAYMKDPRSTQITIPTPDSSSWDPYTYSVGNTDWYNVFMKRNVFNQQHNISLDGGSDKITYFLGLGYTDQNGSLNFFDGYTYKRYNFRANIHAYVTKWMSIGLNTSYSQQNDKIPYAGDRGYNWFYDLPRYWPTLPLVDPNGGYDQSTMAPELSSGSVWKKDQKNDSWIKGSINITPVSGWEIHGDYAYNYYTEPYSSLLGYYGVSTPKDPNYIGNTFNTYSKTFNINHYHSYNLYTSYEKRIGGHYFKAMIGQQEEYQFYSSLTGTNTYLYNQEQPSLTLSYGPTPGASDQGSAWATFGTFGRFNYNYKEKYLLELNGRYMGSSLFPSNTRYHFFSSGSVGWNVSKEIFFAPLSKWINNLKLRVSYGGLGDLSYFLNQSSYYPYLSNLGTNAPTNTSWVFSPTGAREPSITAPGLVSPTITWAKPSMLDFGVDIEFLRDFSVTFDWYKRKIKDLFGPGATYPSLLGTSAPTENNAVTQTLGFDLTVNWNHQFGKVHLTARALLSNYKGKIISYTGNPTNSLNDWYAGESIGAIWGYTTVGKFQSQAQVSKAPNQSYIAANWYPGDIQYADVNLDGKIDAGNYTLQNHGDLSIIGNSTPQYNYGLNLGANWNGFDLFVFFQGVGGGHYFPGSNAFWGVVGTDLYHAPALKTMYDRWTPTNPSGYFPRALFNSGQDVQTQTGYLLSLSYLRLKNLQLGYTLPQRITKRVHIPKLRVYCSIENVFTMASELKHSYIDPEELEAGEQIYPLMRTVSAGVQVNIQ